jgi:hypothetical protein
MIKKEHNNLKLHCEVKNFQKASTKQQIYCERYNWNRESILKRNRNKRSWNKGSMESEYEIHHHSRLPYMSKYNVLIVLHLTVETIGGRDVNHCYVNCQP